MFNLELQRGPRPGIPEGQFPMLTATPGHAAPYAEFATRATTSSRRMFGNDFYSHFGELVMLIGLLEKLPDLAEDIGKWRPRGYGEHLGQLRRLDGFESIEGLGQVARRAFDAVVAGLNALGMMAARRCGAAASPLNQAELAGVQDIALSMKGLLDRAMALADSAESAHGRPAQRRADAIFSSAAAHA